MIVQVRSSGVRLITQHDHGLFSGELAAAWQAPSSGDRLPASVVLATSLHDVSWGDVDRQRPHRDMHGVPLDFLAYPEDEKLVIYQRGIDAISTLDPYAGLLVCLHYGKFVSAERAPMFASRQVKVEARLRAECLARGVSLARLDEHFDLLRVFDVLSLIVCMLAPGIDHAGSPGWLLPSPLLERYGLRVRWQGSSLAVDPFPFCAAVTMQLPFERWSPDGAPTRGYVEARVEPFA